MNKKIVITAAVIIAAALLWWWLRPVPTQAPTVGENGSAEQVANSDSVNDINSGLEASAIGNFDAEFQSIDAELNNL